VDFQIQFLLKSLVATSIGEFFSSRPYKLDEILFQVFGGFGLPWQSIQFTSLIEKRNELNSFSWSMSSEMIYVTVNQRINNHF